ncbi:MAG: glycogen/starch/alpha-glucan phosphorylase, partial [Clostridiales bacterium]|nr:glycogen/starch/alpha-glucan phosphorylase [Clostridiales bacterium]
GTLDGANVEIHDSVGDDNIILFGMTTPEVEALKRNYNPRTFFNSNPVIRKAVDALNDGFSGVSFSDIADSLLNIDPYMVLADFDSYARAQKKAEALYGDRYNWSRMCLINTANAGRFAADRAIREYAGQIWNAEPVPEKGAAKHSSARK